MKLREQASLWCKILALLCIVLALNALQQSVPQAINTFALVVRGTSAINSTVLLYICAPATLMCLFGAALWGVSPFVAALMVPDEMVEKLDTNQETLKLNLSGRAAMKIALVVLSLWLLLRGAVSVGQTIFLYIILANMRSALNSGVVNFNNYQATAVLVGAIFECVLGALLLLLPVPISRRAFPN